MFILIAEIICELRFWIQPQIRTAEEIMVLFSIESKLFDEADQDHLRGIYSSNCLR
jgi:hypothetical protein